jgi:hypothetical protein
MRQISPDSERLANQMADIYSVWLKAVRVAGGRRYRWRRVGGIDHLYLIIGGVETETLGARGPKTEEIYEKHMEAAGFKDSSWARMLIKGKSMKLAQTPTITAAAGELLRAFDKTGLLGDYIRVVGSTAIPVYELAAHTRLDPDCQSSDDADLSWIAGDRTNGSTSPVGFWDTVKEADPTWEVSSERSSQAQNKNGDLIDLWIAPSLSTSYPTMEIIKPLAALGQEWLLGGRPIQGVVSDETGRPARIIAPDPRLFALHKLQLSTLSGERSRKKRDTDQRQGLAIMTLINTKMPEYKFDPEFLYKLPEELQKEYAEWVEVNPNHEEERREIW